VKTKKNAKIGGQIVNEQDNDIDKTYELTVDLQVLKHLGIGLYSNVPAVISEVVANAYDADAEIVEITIDDNEIAIKDDGLGMNVEDANKKYLIVGYEKRKEETETPKLGRDPMGRKGIGKLSAFAIANEVEIQSIKTDPKTGKELGRTAFVMDVAEIEKKAKAKKSYHPPPLDVSDIDFDKGTRVVLRSLKRKRRINATYLRVNVARRFSILGQSFRVFVNQEKVTPADRQYWDKLQFVWGLGKSSDYEQAIKGKKVRKNEVLKEIMNIPGEPDKKVSGWIGTVHFPKELKDGLIDNNGIVVMARGKLVHENLLPFARTARIFAEYVVGEINAEWMDIDEEIDIATSGRQSLKEDYPRFTALQEYTKKRLDEIAGKWTKWRKEVGVKDAVDRHPILQDWLNGMTRDNRKHAEKLISTIEGMPIADEEDKKELFRHGIMAFETLALKGNLEALNKMQIVDVQSLNEILTAMDDLEAAHYYQLTKTRWTILKEFEKLVDKNAKEKFLQDKICNHPWLMDAAWERATNDIRKERRFTTELKAKRLGLDKNKQLSRYDIRYLTVSGKDLVIELKRRGRRLTVPEISKQVRKYAEIINTLAKEFNGSMSSTPDFDIIVVVGILPTGYGATDEAALKPYKAQIMTYERLIKRARTTYEDYLNRQKEIERIQKMVDKL